MKCVFARPDYLCRPAKVALRLRGVPRGLFVAAAIALIYLAAPGHLTNAHAQSNPLDALAPSTLNKKSPLLLQADELIYDNKNNRVTALGNVEIYYNDYTLLADKVIYDQGKSRLTAEGNVRMKEPNGAIVNAERLTLTDDFKEGFIQSLKIVTKDDSRIAAARAIRVDGNTTIFERGVFTPCKPCEKHPARAPLWSVKAAKVIHDKGAQQISYENATFDVLGVPIFWMPYFSHADPTVKRRSGFLNPGFGSTKDLGQTVTIPYYLTIAPNKDLLFNPMYTTRQGVLYKGEWRHRLANGAYNVKFAAIDQQAGDEVDPNHVGFRGSLKTTGSFRLGSWWRAGWNATLESDDTFRRFYKLDSILKTDRISNIHLEGISERSYLGVFAYHFGGLIADDISNSEAVVLPLVDYNYVAANPVLGGELSFDANLISQTRNDGADNSHVIAQLNWRKQLIDGMGQVFTPFAHLRGDIYQVSNANNPLDPLGTDKKYVNRGMATVGLQYQYPFVTRTANASHVIEPIAQIIARPDIRNQNVIPNEDAQSLVFDDTLLFEVDKFSGYDRMETGVRSNVGIQYTYQQHSGGSVRAILGQSYQLSGNNEFFQRTGLESDRSDIVAGLYIEPNEHLLLISQSRFDDQTFELQREDLRAQARYGPFSGSLTYAFIRDSLAGSNLFAQNEQEVVARAALQLTERWNLSGGIRYDFEDGRRMQDYIGLRYSDECFTLSVRYSENFFQDRDLDPERGVFIRFELKSLGGFEFKTDSIQRFVADPEADLRGDAVR